jgi:hypothetical protein
MEELVQALFQIKKKKKTQSLLKTAHPGNRTLVSTVGGYYDTTTPDAPLGFTLDTKKLKLK